jgi:hypothetical protein
LSHRRIYSYRIDIDMCGYWKYNGDGVEHGYGHRVKVRNSREVDMA